MIRAVLLSTRAERDLRGLPREREDRLRTAMVEFARSGRGDLKRLGGTKGREDLFRLRVGDYRIVFALTGTEVKVTRVLHRSEGYDWL